MKTHFLTGTNLEIAAAITRIDGVIREVIVLVNEPSNTVQVANGERVSTQVETQPSDVGGLGDVQDLLDVGYVEACRKTSASRPTLEELQRSLSVYHGSVSDLISEERDER
jgi:hypothetical protein